MNMCANLSAGTHWIVLGDFNVVRGVHDTSGGSLRRSTTIDEFKDYLQAAELDDLRFSGFFHTWCNKWSNDDCISKKLDRVLVYDAWLGKFMNFEAIFLSPSILDHSPSLVKLGLQGRRKNCPFKFFIFLTQWEDFLPLAKICW